MEIKTTHHHSRKRIIIHTIKRGIALSFLAVAVYGIYVFWQKIDKPPQPVSMAMPMGAVEVQSEVVQPQSVPVEQQFLGQTEASQLIEIRARIRGFLDKRLFEEGQAVKGGQQLFLIDPRSYEADLQVARAGLASAEAHLERAKLQVRRYQDLLTKNAATTNELEQWQTEQRVGEADVKLEKAKIAQSELSLSYTRIMAPIDGMIGKALKDPGTFVDDGSNSLLAKLQQVDPLYISYSMSEKEMLYWKNLQTTGKINMPELDQLEVRVTLTDGSEYPLKGRVNFMNPEVNISTGTAFVRATIPNPDKALRPGQFVHVIIDGITRKDAVLVPQKAVLQTPTGSTVYTVGQDGTVNISPVTLGQWYKDKYIIEKGLKAGERVVLDQLLKIRPGMKVKLAEAGNGTESVSQK